MVYLLHFSRRVSVNHTTQHYMGWTDDLEHRIKCHSSGNGARLMEVCSERGIAFVVARVWDGDRGRERALKKCKNGPRFCPICNSDAWRLAKAGTWRQEDVRRVLRGVPF